MTTHDRVKVASYELAAAAPKGWIASIHRDAERMSSRTRVFLLTRGFASDLFLFFVPNTYTPAATSRFS
jgi:hypothetical protein